MIKNYLKISTRNLVKHKMFMSINIFGLTVGLIGFLLIGEYIRFEEGYDSFFEDADQLYRVSVVEVVDGEVLGKDAMASQPTAGALVAEIPEVLIATTTYKLDELIVRKDGAIIKEGNVISGDSSFLKLFTYEIYQGDRESMLNEPNSIVLSESKAQEYFGATNPIGQTIEVLGSYDRVFTVTGVIEDIPNNTHYKFDMILSDQSLTNRGDYGEWNWNNNYTYARLDKNTDHEILKGKLEEFSRLHYSEETSSFFTVYPVKDIHLFSDYTFEPEASGSYKAVNFMFIISIFILVIAWVNYVNLSTARAIDRAKEVGLRKVIGAFRAQLVTQFLIEALMVNMIAALLALGLAEMLLPYFNQLVGTVILDHVWNYPPFLIKLFVFFLIGALVSGFYPALVLSSYKPIASLKGLYRNSKSGVFLRKSLVMVQFVISIGLIAGTLIVNKQVDYMLEKDLGISTDHVVGFAMPRNKPGERAEHRSQVKVFREQLGMHSSIDAVAATSNLPGGNEVDINSTTSAITVVGKTDRIRGATTYIQYAEDGFIEAMGMGILEGRAFQLNVLASDTLAAIVNEAFLKNMNLSLSADIVGSQIQFGTNADNTKFDIVGVVKNFNRTSLKLDVEPTIYFPTRYGSETIVKFNPDSYIEGLDYVEAQWKVFFPDTPFDYSFLDDRFASLYDQDQKFRRVFGVFSILAILVATLGLFGLTSFLSVQRTKEVGVRKVLGASTIGIISLFFSDFMALIGIATVIGAPIVYFGMSAWLENYASRIEFPWLLVGVSLLAVIVSALLTVGYQTYKVAILNPAKTLKQE